MILAGPLAGGADVTERTASPGAGADEKTIAGTRRKARMFQRTKSPQPCFRALDARPRSALSRSALGGR
jgi:hypothetical protein